NLPIGAASRWCSSTSGLQPDCNVASNELPGSNAHAPAGRAFLSGIDLLAPITSVRTLLSGCKPDVPVWLRQIVGHSLIVVLRAAKGDNLREVHVSLQSRGAGRFRIPSFRPRHDDRNYSSHRRPPAPSHVPQSSAQ